MKQLRQPLQLPLSTSSGLTREGGTPMTGGGRTGGRPLIGNPRNGRGKTGRRRRYQPCRSINLHFQSVQIHQCGLPDRRHAAVWIRRVQIQQSGRSCKISKCATQRTSCICWDTSSSNSSSSNISCCFDNYSRSNNSNTSSQVLCTSGRSMSQTRRTEKSYTMDG